MNAEACIIKEFYINNLHGQINIRIPFSSNYKIIVAENGYGKTTILNSFYALVSGDISKLRKVVFDSIGLVFSDGEDISFKKSDFDVDLGRFEENFFFQHIKSELGIDYLIRLENEARRYGRMEIHRAPSFRYAASVTRIQPLDIFDNLKQMGLSRRDKKINTSAKEKLHLIKSKFPLKTLHLPTYRRVEEDIKAFNGIRDEHSPQHSSINFGMRDVEESIKEITSEILSSSVEWFSKINGQMLSQLVNGFVVSDEMKQSISRPKAVEIVLERIGKNISPSHKEQILNMVNSGEILKGHDPLIYFVSNLLNVYEQQQENDAAIQHFTKVSNKYLNDKEIIYDESNVTINIIRKKNKTPVDIESLSSGEKQIISLFALLYLQKKDDLAIFFDEPELSLSIEWQKSLLPDIVSSGKCKFLLSTTHSPFIFDNELEANTVDLAEYIKESQCQE